MYAWGTEIEAVRAIESLYRAGGAEAIRALGLDAVRHIVALQVLGVRALAELLRIGVRFR